MSNLLLLKVWKWKKTWKYKKNHLKICCW